MARPLAVDAVSVQRRRVEPLYVLNAAVVTVVAIALWIGGVALFATAFTVIALVGVFGNVSRYFGWFAGWGRWQP
jgi:hypothetical protein